MSRIGLGLSYYSIPTADLDNQIPAGVLRTKYAYSYINENEETVNNLTPTWREAINHLNPKMLNSVKFHNGESFNILIDCFGNLNGENRAAKDAGAGKIQPAYSLFSILEFEAFEWDDTDSI